MIADRVRIVREGGGGKIALSAVRSSRVRSGDGEDEGPEEGPGGRRGNLGFVGGLVGGGEVEEAGKVGRILHAVRKVCGGSRFRFRYCYVT